MRGRYRKGMILSTGRSEPPPSRTGPVALFWSRRKAWRVSYRDAQGRNRTTDTVIFSHVLYQLSYLGPALGSGGL